MKLETELQCLLFEVEESDIELDQIACLQMENFEALRRSEVTELLTSRSSLLTFVLCW
jgi:hypothetical protein